jgi:hypothetical protein
MRWGRPKVRRFSRRDRCRPFTRNISKLNTESLPPGGWSKVCSIRAHGPVPPSFADFFSASRDFQNACSLLRDEFTNPIKGPWVNRVRIRVFISLACWPRGAVKISARFQLRTGGQAHKFRREFPEIFFSERKFQKKVPRNSGWGGR